MNRPYNQDDDNTFTFYSAVFIFLNYFW